MEGLNTVIHDGIGDDANCEGTKSRPDTLLCIANVVRFTVIKAGTDKCDATSVRVTQLCQQKVQCELHLDDTINLGSKTELTFMAGIVT